MGKMEIRVKHAYEEKKREQYEAIQSIRIMQLVVREAWMLMSLNSLMRMDYILNLVPLKGFPPGTPVSSPKDMHVSEVLPRVVKFQQLKQQEQDPTNLYISNLPVSMDEQELENMLKPFGHVISTRILRDASGVSRGVGFARMESTEKCDVVIQHFNGKFLKTPPGVPVLVWAFFQSVMDICVQAYQTSHPTGKKKSLLCLEHHFFLVL
ncbi:hypothetical protein QTP70_007367 [Hemibagrus guttatus]|uniref:RRM domain-containing protein n=1 Tax=Hemibagrus guttatus TaxID=175788 RepID=A0AAE0VDU1_9TELE|nr:hypothetical protein QTP70_007367 [Hemibagrus guttatus]